MEVHVELVKAKVKELQSTDEANHVKNRGRKLKKGVERAVAGKFEAIASKLRSDEEEIQKELRELSEKNDLGFYNLILSGCEECLVVLNARPAKTKKSKQPENDIDLRLWKMIETLAGGKLDTKQSGREP